jgi:hypothetical protein
LRADHGWGGRLVLAGPHVPVGSTRSAEEERLAARPGLEADLVRLGTVTEEEKRWLLEHAAAVLYPTVDEGFGLLPFEAARAGSACAHAGVGALAEVLSDVAPVLVPWDADASAARVLDLISDPARRKRNVDAVLRVAERRTWSATAERVVASYDRALSEPRRAISWEARDRLATEVELDQLRGHVLGLEQEREILRAFRDSVGEDGARLVGPHPLLDDPDRRALLALVARPALRRPFLAALRLGYRLGHR